MQQQHSRSSATQHEGAGAEAPPPAPPVPPRAVCEPQTPGGQQPRTPERRRQIDQALAVRQLTAENQALRAQIVSVLEERAAEQARLLQAIAELKAGLAQETALRKMVVSDLQARLEDCRAKVGEIEAQLQSEVVLRAARGAPREEGGGRVPRPCRFFGTRAGCRHGEACRFAHTSTVRLVEHASPYTVGCTRGPPHPFAIRGKPIASSTCRYGK